MNGLYLFIVSYLCSKERIDGLKYCPLQVCCIAMVDKKLASKWVCQKASNMISHCWRVWLFFSSFFIYNVLCTMCFWSMLIVEVFDYLVCLDHVFASAADILSAGVGLQLWNRTKRGGGAEWKVARDRERDGERGEMGRWREEEDGRGREGMGGGATGTEKK